MAISLVSNPSFSKVLIKICCVAFSCGAVITDTKVLTLAGEKEEGGVGHRQFCLFLSTSLAQATHPQSIKKVNKKTSDTQFAFCCIYKLDLDLESSGPTSPQTNRHATDSSAGRWQSKTVEIGVAYAKFECGVLRHWCRGVGVSGCVVLMQKSRTCQIRKSRVHL